MGLKEGYSEKDDVLVDLDRLPLEIKIRQDKKKVRGRKSWGISLNQYTLVAYLPAIYVRALQ